MQQLNGLGNEYVGGLIMPAFHILLDESFELGSETNRHTCKLAPVTRPLQ